MFSESHCHIDTKSIDAVKRAEEKGVKLILTAGIDIKSSVEAVRTAEMFPTVKACVGIHPWNADQYSEEAVRKIGELAKASKVVAISEIGLDYVGRRDSEGKFVNEYIDKSIQLELFREQLKLAKKLKLPALVHDRTPDEEVLDVIEEVDLSKVGVAIHGFSKDIYYAQRCINMGIYLSIGQRALFDPNNKSFREIVAKISIEYILTETDSGEPEGVIKVVEKISELKNLDLEYVGETATNNLKKLLKIN
ncbi:TatD family hydrolase [Candidatus Bathyarchaeota archaeon]|nr:TatD family hydrolase [Candidatus Bathyarchaeota archaeon]